ncbi:ABC transporter substrate-binding protein [Sporolactobacillus terrae]|uniref:ABC transporter substrate-binding protein n=1 Tax=Sporolactobacillus terrae TaxID=269673 RepID=A0A410DBJ8_9BACL|nr:ABC transporter substrate-binding protein [Sporolactobacillus terrae]QAA23391.1 ABC transporter substrate-binding protein [Sporolactobacillus terrae]QAA26362.1 ABC transporter substrate-binding protein [Sporolactobacillus terrae]BBN99818.1 ABC transporter substrate-binding protein [Sporolactobacillus terrae]
MTKKSKTNRLTKWLLYVGVAVIVLIAAVFSVSHITNKKSAATKKDDNYVLKLADSSGLCEAPQQIAIEKGIFKKYGINYKNVKIGDLSGTEALTAGKVDATNSLLASIVQPLTNGAELKITTGLHTGCLQILVGKNSKIKSVKDLKGKKIGVGTVAGSAATFAKRVLSYNGLHVATKNSDVQFIAYDSASLPIVLNKGQVDAIAVGDPDTQIAIKNYGFKSLASSATTEPFKDEYCCVAYVSNKLAKEHPEIARKFTLALQEAAQWIAKNQSNSVHIQTEKKYIAGEEKTNLSALETYQWEPSYDGAKKAFKQTADSLQDIGIISKDVDTQALTDHSFLKVKGIH